MKQNSRLKKLKTGLLAFALAAVVGVFLYFCGEYILWAVVAGSMLWAWGSMALVGIYMIGGIGRAFWAAAEGLLAANDKKKQSKEESYEFPVARITSETH
jgi:hypothetical protein